MNLKRTNIMLAVLLLIMSTLAVSLDVDHEQPNFEFLPDMKRSPAFDAFAANRNFPNGRTLQAPVRGTIARGNLPLYYEPTKEDAVRAGEELINPFALPESTDSDEKKSDNQSSDPTNLIAKPTVEPKNKAQTISVLPKPDPRSRLNASISRGAKSYLVYCVSCHGSSGAGDGLVAKRGFPPPPPLTTGKSAQMKDGQLFHILTYGQGSMASMAAQLTRERRWDTINYVRSMQQGTKQSPTKQTSNPESKPSSLKEHKP